VKGDSGDHIANKYFHLASFNPIYLIALCMLRNYRRGSLSDSPGHDSDCLFIVDCLIAGDCE
jgi:hypothetical protein